MIFVLLNYLSAKILIYSIKIIKELSKVLQFSSDSLSLSRSVPSSDDLANRKKLDSLAGWEGRGIIGNRGGASTEDGGAR